MHSTSGYLLGSDQVYKSHVVFNFPSNLAGDVNPVRVNIMWPSCGRFHNLWVTQVLK